MRFHLSIRHVAVTLGLVLCATSLSADEPWSEELKVLREQNRLLQEQLKAQQAHIDELEAKVNRVVERQAKSTSIESPTKVAADEPVSLPTTRSNQAVRVAGEVSAAFFAGSSQSFFPNAEFRIDDARISFEAPVWRDIYFFGESELLTREAFDETAHLGEFYIEFEGVSRAWGEDGMLTLRLGRLDIPFGEEYQHRRPSDNPLVSHSISDVWGIDEGIEGFGSIGRWQYILAVQNGGHSQLHDYNADKAVVGRLGYSPTAWFSLSGSAMRTGKLTGPNERFSEVWIGNSVFTPFASNAKNATLQANLFEGDASARWKSGQLTLAYGHAHYTDEASSDDTRNFNYGYAEAVQHFTSRVYGAARYSGLRVSDGYALSGWSNGKDPGLVDRIRRLSLGLGYRFGDPLVIKFEYTWENARLATGQDRPDADIFSSQVAVRF